MNIKRYKELSEKTVNDYQPVVLTITIRDAWILVAAIQLSARNPEIGQVRPILVEIGQMFQSVIVAVHPEVQELLDMGWMNPESDDKPDRIH